MEYARAIFASQTPWCGRLMEVSCVGAIWTIRMEGVEQVWDWRDGPPPIRALEPARRTRADAMSRHAPVHMQCQTVGSVLRLDSGLEYEQARQLDRDRDVRWIVAQPLELMFEDGARHVPDLLAEHRSGHVVIWDVRPEARQDETFQHQAEATRSACEAVGWGYVVQGGESRPRRLNLLWLASFRHRPGWPHHADRHRLRRLAASGEVTVSDLIGLDTGDGHLTALMWHMLWAGELLLDLDEPITAESMVGVGEVADA